MNYSPIKIHHSIFEYLNDKVGFRPIEINGNPILLKIGEAIILNFHCYKANISDKILFYLLFTNYSISKCVFILPENLCDPLTFRMQC